MKKFKLVREKTALEFVKKTVIVLISQVLFAVGMGLLVKCAMGQTGLSTLATGMSVTFGVSIGTGFIILNIMLAIFLAIFYREPLYVGSLIDAFLFGIIFDIVYAVFYAKLPEVPLVLALILPVVGVFVIAFAFSMYSPINFGVKVYDGLVLFFNKKIGLSFTLTFIILNSASVGLGLLLGAKLFTDVGYGTLVTIFLLGVFTDLIKDRVETGVRKIFALPK